MLCTNQIKSPSKTKIGESITIPCGKCLNCRLNKRDLWVTRCLLESQASISSLFVTLTFDDQHLEILRQIGPWQVYKRFLEKLRYMEVQRQNPLPIRSFGVLEHGSLTDRPHYHAMIWNTTTSFPMGEKYLDGRPRLRLSSEAWPLGHVDTQPLNPSSCRYVCKYVTKFNTEGTLQTYPQNQWHPNKPLPAHLVFHARKPPLGAVGLAMHVEQLSRSPRKNWVHGNTITIGGKKWALDRTMLKLYRQLMKKYSMRSEGQYENERFENRQMKKIEENLLTLSQEHYRDKMNRQRELLYEWGKEKKERKRRSLEYYYSNVAASKSNLTQVN